MNTKLHTVALLAGFIGLMFLSLFSVGHGMDMKHGASDCAFATQSHTVCPMSVLDHIGAWKAVFMNMVPALFVVLLVGATIVLAGKAPHLLRRLLLHAIPLSPRFQQLSFSIYTYTYRALQELFARGILHPKLF